MAFFKAYRGTTQRRLVRMERLIWALIYGGLLAVVVAYFMSEPAQTLATSLTYGGAVAVAVGVVMIFVRARLREE
ncbi:MAG: hypothetical protein QE265_03205 [Rhodoferax sp.]|nr:hypothetical protein [Rhodoferax sp.]